MKFTKSQKSIFVILILHFVAVSGIFLGYLDYLLPLSAVNLLITSFLLYLNQKDLNTSFYISSVIIIIVTFFIEVIGVNTGIFFGEYTYLDSLGPKIFNTPPIIGFNWWIMIVSSAGVLASTKFPLLVKAFLSTCLMLVIDLWIEPISDALNFWEWKDGVIPLKNYIGWFITGFSLQILYWQSPFKKDNPIARSVYFILLFFFIIFNLFLG